MFTSQPQAVEVYERGGWLPASMLGWRHDSDGVCSAWVRVEFAGVVEDAWVELTRLRLPQSPARHLSLARAPKATVMAMSSRTAPPEVAPPNPAETRQLPLVRDGGAPPSDRRVPPGGGRRRAPETGEPVPGRHRAPAEQGRHRAADTGMLVAVPEGAPASPRPGLPEGGGTPMAGVDAWSSPPARSELPPAGPVVRGQGAREIDPERLTRPMRLEHGVGSARPSLRDSLGV